MADPMTDAILADLPEPDAPSPQTQRLAAGVALVQRGQGYREAAQRVGVARSTLWRYAHGIDCGRSATGRNESMAAIEREIEDLAATITVRAAESILSRLDDGSMRPSEEVKALQVARDTLAMRRDWSRSNTGAQAAVNALASALEGLRGHVTIQQPDPVQDAELVESSGGD